MNIAVYAGSFDPLHIGHLAIMEYLTRDRAFDWVYLVVSPQNPLKDAEKARNAAQRYEQALQAVARHPGLRVRVDDIELHMPPPHYTIKTLDALKKREPDNEFTLVVGADNLHGIHRWRDFPRILSEYGLAVYPRNGYDMARTRALLYQQMRYLPGSYVLDSAEAHEMPGSWSLEEHQNLYKIQLIDAPLTDISSTEIREKEAAGMDMSAYKM